MEVVDRQRLVTRSGLEKLLCCSWCPKEPASFLSEAWEKVHSLSENTHATNHSRQCRRRKRGTGKHGFALAVGWDAYRGDVPDDLRVLCCLMMPEIRCMSPVKPDDQPCLPDFSVERKPTEDTVPEWLKDTPNTEPSHPGGVDVEMSEQFVEAVEHEPLS